MSRQLVGSVIVVTLSLAVSFAYGEPRRGGGGGSERSESERSEGEHSNNERSEGEKSNSQHSSGQKSNAKKPPGGSWSEYDSEGKQGKEKNGKENNESGAEGAAAGHAAEKNKDSQPSGKEGAAAGAAHANKNSPQASGAEGAAAGAAHANKNSPQASGAEGAAAGAAAENRNSPKASGAQGAAAGAAVSNRNQPQFSGAQGAAAGAAAANRKQPQYSGAEGAAAGAAASNRNQPQFSGAQGVAAGAAVANSNQPRYSGAQGVAAGAAVANHNSPAASGAQGAAAGYAAVRSNVDHPGMYSQQWYGDHQSAWTARGWAAGAVWVPPTWGSVIRHCQIDVGATPISYNYGNNVTCIGNNVLINGQSAGTAEEFSQQADEIAEAGTAAMTDATERWLPLGVFALVRNEHQHPQLIVQLAMNPQGVIRGNYTDDVTDSTLPIHGGVNLQTQRAAWTVGDNKYSVMEAGLQNLTQREAPALIHKNGTTQRWLLVRLDQSSQRDNGGSAADALP